MCVKIHRLSGLQRMKQTQRSLDRPWPRHRKNGRREAQKEMHNEERQEDKDSEEQRDPGSERNRETEAKRLRC